MIEQVINRRNMHLAFKQVLRNKGRAGVDGMQVKELKGYIDKNIRSVAQSMIKGSYLPQPILGINIPKSNGKMCLLGIPQLQTGGCSKQLPKPLHRCLFEYEFKVHSYGFRHAKQHISVYNSQSSTSMKAISILLI